MSLDAHTPSQLPHLFQDKQTGTHVFFSEVVSIVVLYLYQQELDFLLQNTFYISTSFNKKWSQVGKPSNMELSILR